MAIFNPLTQKIIVTALDSDKPRYAVPAPVALALMLSMFGFASITIGAVAPGDVRTLWYNKDTNKFRRYNPLTAAWADLTPSQWFLHTIQIAFRSANVEGVMADADKVPFFDVSADELKMISVLDFKASLGVSGWVQWQDTITLDAPTAIVNFNDLPLSYTSFAIRADFTTFGGAVTKYNPRLRGVYSTGSYMDLTVGLSGTIPSGLQRRTYQFSGDRGDETGFIFRDFAWVNTELDNNNHDIPVPLTNRIRHLRLVVPDGGPMGDGQNSPVDTWQFAAGSTFKLWVR